MKPFPQLSVDVSRLLLLDAMNTPLCCSDVNIKPGYSVGVTSSAVLRNEVQYQTAVCSSMSKEIQDNIGLAGNSSQLLNKSSTKLKAISAWSFTFSRTFLTLNSYWL